MPTDVTAVNTAPIPVRPGHTLGGRLLILMFLTPLLLAAISTALGWPVSGRDDDNYLGELESRPLIAAALDPVSWTFLSVVSWVSGTSQEVLRWIGFVIAYITVRVVQRRAQDPNVTVLLVVSFLPLYSNLYFNQLRLAIGLLLFLYVLTSRRFSKFAVPVAALGHSSFALLLFPPLVALLPLLTSYIELVNPDAAVAVKIFAYAENAETEMPWYFGWELLASMLLLMQRRHLRLVLELVAFVWAARTLASQFNIDIGRRILEIAVLAYSPIGLLLWRKIAPPPLLMWYYGTLGILQTTISVYSGVIVLG